LFIFFLLSTPPTPTLFPYTTLFRSQSRPVDFLQDCCAVVGTGGFTSLLELSPFDLHRVRADCLSRQASRAHAIRQRGDGRSADLDRKSTRLNSSHVSISYAVFCLKK